MRQKLYAFCKCSQINEIIRIHITIGQLYPLVMESSAKVSQVKVL